MPQRDAHLAKAEHLLVVYHNLSSHVPASLDVQVVCLFYAALHYVDAYFHHMNIIAPNGHRPSHRWRANLVRAHLGSDLAGDYDELRIRSEDARYDVISFVQPHVIALSTGELTRIRTHVRMALGLPL